ncbi:MAG TPA: dihydroorotase family protein [Hyphomicrobiaceae bacterium]|nr:dihydroorotase family protein [Hyphomicrobiaceae bacterium]
MMHFDTVLAGGDLLLPGADPIAADLAIRDGKFAAILARGTAVSAAARLNITGLTVLPGVVDAHLHLGHGKDISRPRVAADAAQETAAAAVGGITTFLPYLMATEPFETIFAEVLAVTEAGARIDFGYHCIISTEAQLAGVPHYARDFGAPSFKIFMNNRGGEGQRLGLPDIDDGFLFRLCEAAAASGGIVCPHPENIEISWVLRDRLKRADPDGRGGLSAWNASRPPMVEADAVQRAALTAQAAGCGLYIVHTTSAAALAAAVSARRRGCRIAIETCPHYLTHDVAFVGGDVGKINPPLRGAIDRDALWAGIADGSIDTVATDHVHRDLSGKAGGIWNAAPGCPGLETLLPVMLSEGHCRRGIPLRRIVELLARNPAQEMGLGHAKGTIAIGHDADVAIVDLKRKWTLERPGVHSSAGYSIYEGWQFQGQVVHTLVRGRVVLRDLAVVPESAGWGRYQHRLTPKRAGAEARPQALGATGPTPS